MIEIPADIDKITTRLKIASLNPMQIQTIDSIKQSNEVILHSPTGSGKTLAFLIPVLQSINPDIRQVQALIMVPSRELALQIENILKQIQPGFKITCCYGGHKREIEENNLIEPPAIVIATAGRMADHLRRGNINPGQISFLVLDEFDKILELGFLEEMEFILSKLPAVTKKLLTSATKAIEIPDFLKLVSPTILNYLSDNQDTAINLIYRYINSSDKNKIDVLFVLLCALKDTSTIVFCNHRDAVERAHGLLADKGILSVFYHGGMEQIDRETALCKFRNGTSNILITTDLASRGLDISNIRSIVHYHLPDSSESFTHRNGRTARMNASGSVFMIIGPEEKLPDYVPESMSEMQLPSDYSIPDKPKWSTLFIAAGKKDKINKIDIVGFLTNKGKLKKDEIGLIDVKDFTSFVAVRKSKIGMVVEAVKNEKIKNKKVKMNVAR